MSPYPPESRHVESLPVVEPPDLPADPVPWNQRALAFMRLCAKVPPDHFVDPDYFEEPAT